jgi:hypothetical protein
MVRMGVVETFDMAGHGALLTWQWPRATPGAIKVQRPRKMPTSKGDDAADRLARVHQVEGRGTFLPASLMYFCSGKPMHFFTPALTEVRASVRPTFLVIHVCGEVDKGITKKEARAPPNRTRSCYRHPARG